MAECVLILQAEAGPAKILSDFFTKRGNEVIQASRVIDASELLSKRGKTVDLILIDLHLPGNDWLDLVKHIRQQYPHIHIILTNRYPDMRREMLAKNEKVQIFLREPFTSNWIEAALKKLEPGGGQEISHLPPVRVSMRLKITVPYAVLALIFAVAASFLVTRYVLESIRDRFTNQLITAGKLAEDWMVQEETQLLETLRLAAHTEGVAEAAQSADANELRLILLPLAVNAQQEAIDVLDLNGISLLSMRHRAGSTVEDYAITQGDSTFARLEFVQKVLLEQIDAKGDKYAQVVDTPHGRYFFISGPIYDLQGQLCGVILTGKSLATLARNMEQNTYAQVTIYSQDGAPTESTLFLKQDIHPVETSMAAGLLQHQETASPIRSLSVAQRAYAEILGPWEARGGEDLGILGVALNQDFSSAPSSVTRLQAFFVVSLAFLGVVILGIMLANQITRPLSQVVTASAEVARGNFEVKVPSSGNDEVAVLGSAFNRMVIGLQEGFIYRDLLGRAVSPEVRETLRQSFASGDLKLEGQNAEATVLMSDIRDFTRICEKEAPTTILQWLNEYFGKLAPVVGAHGGVVDKFEGDAMLTFFGILPTPSSPQESAHQACRAALEMLLVIQEINTQRSERGQPPLTTGIGVNTGELIAGGLGASDRLNYTIIGDTVNTTQRLQEITREFGESGVVISESTLLALGERSREFHVEALGERAVKGRQEVLRIFRLLPAPHMEQAA